MGLSRTSVPQCHFGSYHAQLRDWRRENPSSAPAVRAAGRAAAPRSNPETAAEPRCSAHARVLWANGRPGPPQRQRERRHQGPRGLGVRRCGHRRARLPAGAGPPPGAAARGAAQAGGARQRCPTSRKAGGTGPQAAAVKDRPDRPDGPRHRGGRARDAREVLAEACAVGARSLRALRVVLEQARPAAN